MKKQFFVIINFPKLLVIINIFLQISQDPGSKFKGGVNRMKGQARGSKKILGGRGCKKIKISLNTVKFILSTLEGIHLVCLS